MPLLTFDREPKPQAIENLLNESGLKAQDKEAGLKGLLKKNNLTPDHLLSELAEIARSGDTDAIRLRAIETGLKLNPETREALNDNSKIPFAPITIVINDSQKPEGLNPILIPRKTVTVINHERSETGSTEST